MAVVKVTLRSGIFDEYEIAIQVPIHWYQNQNSRCHIWSDIATLMNTAAIVKNGGYECRSRSRSKIFKIATPIYVYIEKVSCPGSRQDIGTDPKTEIPFSGIPIRVSFQVTPTLDRYNNIKALIRSFLLRQGGCAHMWQIILGLFASTEKLSLGRIHTHKA